MQEDQDNERESGDVAVYAEVDQAWIWAPLNRCCLSPMSQSGS